MISLLEISIKSAIECLELFRLKIKMAALVKKAPALFNAARELATPHMNTFLRYAKVTSLLEIILRITFDLVSILRSNW